MQVPGDIFKMAIISVIISIGNHSSVDYLFISACKYVAGVVGNGE